MALERRHGSGGVRLVLTECPACGKDLDTRKPHINNKERQRHLTTHSPEDFGLSPLQNGDSPGGTA